MNVQNNPVELRFQSQVNIEDSKKRLSLSPNEPALDDLLLDLFASSINSHGESSQYFPSSLDGYDIKFINDKPYLNTLEEETQKKHENLKQNNNLHKLDVKETEKEKKLILSDRKERAKNIEKLNYFVSLKQSKIVEGSVLRHKLPENTDFDVTDDGRVCIRDFKKNKLYLSGDNIPKALTINGTEFKCKDISKSKKFSDLESLLEDYSKLQSQIDSLQLEIDRLQHEIEQDMLREDQEKKVHSSRETLANRPLKETEKDKKTDEKDDEKYNKYISNIKFAELVSMVVLSYIFNKNQENKRNYDRREKESQDKHDAIKRDEIKKEIRKEERVHKEIDLESIKRSSSQV